MYKINKMKENQFQTNPKIVNTEAKLKPLTHIYTITHFPGFVHVLQEQVPVLS
jgi:hypothetical protein